MNQSVFMMKPSRLISSLIILSLVVLLSACQAVSLQDLVDTIPAETPRLNSLTPVSTAEDFIITPTPQPTATPGIIAQSVTDLSVETGLDRQILLGFTGEDWINLGISALIFIFGSLIVSRIVQFVLGKIVRSTPGKRDDEFFAAIRRQIELLISVLVLNYATNRLAFISVFWKETLNQILFAILIITMAAILWKLVDLYLIWHRAKAVPQGQVDHDASLRYLFRRFLRALLVVSAVTLILSNFGINITFILAVLGAVVVALLIAGQDMLTDMIYGFILLFDKPFGVGDRIEIKELNTWGDVVEIGIRTTRVRTRDNRLVVYPNSSIGHSQVINYSQPDAQIRVQIDLNVAYGEEPARIETVIVEAVREVEGVATDKPVDVLLKNVSKSGLTFQVRWWLQDYQTDRYLVDKVLRAVYAAILKSDIAMSLDSYDLNLFMQASEAQLGASPEDAHEE